MKIKAKDKSLVFCPDQDAECYQLGSFFRDITHEITVVNGKITELKVSFFNLWNNVMPIIKGKK